MIWPQKMCIASSTEGERVRERERQRETEGERDRERGRQGEREVSEKNVARTGITPPRH